MQLKLKKSKGCEDPWENSEKSVNPQRYFQNIFKQPGSIQMSLKKIGKSQVDTGDS